MMAAPPSLQRSWRAIAGLLAVNPDSISQARTWLIGNVELTAAWRARKAMEYDDRHASASDELRALAEKLQHIVAVDPVWRAYAAARKSADDRILIAEIETDYLKGLGFRRPIPEDGRQFLQGLMKEISAQLPDKTKMGPPQLQA
jgi:hypothetical protein